MSDLSYTIEVKGVQDLDKLANTIDKVTGVLNAGVGSGKSLEELRKILVGLKGKGSALEELATAAKGFTDATAEMRKGIGNNFKGLERLLKSEFAQLRNIMQQGGAAAGMAAGQGMAEGMKQAGAQVDKEATVISRTAKARMRALQGDLAGYYNMLRLRIEGKQTNDKALQEDLAGYQQMLKLKIAAERQAGLEIAAARESAEARNIKALQDDLAGYQQMLKLKVAAEHQNAQQIAAARESAEARNLKALQDDLAGYQQMLKLKVAAEHQNAQQIAAARESAEARNLKALQEDLAGYQQMLKLKVAAEHQNAQQIAAARESAEARNLKALQDDLAGYQQMLKLKVAAELATAKEIAAARESAEARNLKALQDDLAGYRHMLNLKVAAANKAAVDIAAAARKQVQYATSAPSGSFSRLSDRATKLIPGTYGVEDLRRTDDELVKVRKSAKETGVAFGYTAKQANDLHSVARGLASGFNLLWLTWGNLVPLFIGAGISNAFVQTTKTGMEVAHTLEIIGVLGGNTAEEMGALTKELDRLGTVGPHGPIEIADAMKVLSLAGLKANEILAVTQDVLNFSIAGTTDLKTAADALVSISTAFGMGAQGFGRVSDVVSKAAAESKTSVESFANAMKTASVIGKQYGVTLEDTATGIAALSQLGIEGTAAGTALRNMYADLSGRSMQVAKVLRAQGIEMRDLTNGGFRPMLEVVADLDAKLSKMTAIGQKNFLQALLSERGAKGMIEYLALIRTNAKDTSSTFRNALEEMRASIDQSYGFAAVSAAKLNQTVLSSFKGVSATLKTTFNEAYREIEPQLYLIALNLREAFASEGFKSALSALTNLIAKFATVLAENAHMLGVVAASAAGLKLAQMALISTSSALARLMSIGTAAKVADTIATEANTAANIANNAAKVGFAATALKWLGRANIVLGVVTTAWMAYEFFMGKSSDSEAEAARRYNDGLAKSLEDQASKLERINLLRAQGLSLADAEARINGEESKNAIAKNSNAAQLQAQAAKAKKDYDDLLAQSKAGKLGAVEAARLPTLRAQSIKAAVAAANATIELQDQQNRIDAGTQRYIQASRRTEEINLAERKRAMEAMQVFGNLDYQQGADKTDKEALIAVSAAKQNLMKETEEANRNELSSLKAHYDSKQKLLKSEADNQLITQGEFVLKEIALTEESEAKQLEALTAGSERYFQAYERQSQALLDAQVKWRKLNAGANKNAWDKEAEDTQTALDNLARDYVTTITKMGDDARAIKNNAFERLQLSINKARGELVALDKQFKDFWESEENNAKKRERQTGKEDALRYATPEQAAMIEAASSEFERFQSRIEEVDKQILLLNNSYQAMLELKKGAIAPTREEQVQIDLLRQSLEKLNTERDKLLGAQASGSAQAGQDALTKFAKDEAKRLQDGLSDSIMTALFEGGKAGSKKLRDLVVNELKKPIKLVLDVVANMIMSGLGLGSAAGGAAGSAGGSFLSSAAGGLSGNFLTGGVGMSGMAGFTSGLSAWGAGGSVMGVLSNPGLYSLAEIAGALGPIALGIGAVVMLLKKGKTPGEQHTGGFYSSTGASGMEGALGITNGTEGWARDMIKRANPEIEKMVKNTVDAVIKSSTAQAKILGMDIAVGIDAGLAANTNGKAKNKNVFGYFDVKINGETVSEYVNRELGKDLTEAVSTWTSDMQDAVSEWVLGGEDAAKALAKDGETATQTVTRLSTSLVLVNNALNTMNKTLLTASIASASFANSVVEEFGSPENFASAHQAYFDAFYTEAERAAATTRNLGLQFASLNLELPTTNAEYRKLVEAQDLTTEAGRKNYAMLLQLAPAFNSVTLAAQALIDNIAAALSESGDEYFASIEAVSNATRDAAIASQAAATALRDALASAGQGIKEFADQITREALGGTAQGGALAASKYYTDLALARQGDVSASERITKSAGDYLSDQRAASRSSFEARRAALTMANELRALPAVKAFEEKLLEAVSGTTTAVNSLNGKLTVDLTLTARSEIYKLIQFIANTDKLPPDLKELALETSSTLRKTVNYVVGSQLPEDLKQLALTNVSDLAKTVRFVADSTGMSEEAKKLALEATSTVSRVIQLSVTGLISDQDKELALLTSSSITKTIHAAAGDMDMAALAIAVAQSGTVKRIIEASGGVLTADQAKLLDGITNYNKMITLGVVMDENSLTAAQALMQSVFGTIDFGAILGGAAGLGGVSVTDLFGAGTVDRLTSIRNFINSLNWAPENKTASAWATYTAAQQYGVSQAEIATAAGYDLGSVQALFDAAGVPRFALGGVHQGGWAMVGEQGPELVHMPAGRVYNNGQTQDILAGDSAAASEIAALRQQIEEMRAEIRATAVNTGKTQRLLDRVTRNGETMQVTVVA